MSNPDGAPGPGADTARRPSWLGRVSGSLRARLTVAFGGIILVTLLLAGSAFVLILREYQIRRETNRVAELTIPLSGQVRSLEQLGVGAPEIVNYIERQAAELDLRVVLADAHGVIFADTDETLIGKQLRIQQATRLGLQRRVRQATIDDAQGELIFMVSPAIGLSRAEAGSPGAGASPPSGGSVGERFFGRPTAYMVALSIPRQSVAMAWLELLPRLSLAALGALLLSVAVAWPLAGSIARPLARMTRAAEELARGRLDQQIPVHGRDEVARLAQAFNTMAREVGASQRTLRDFLANVSHDLRTPLTSIQGFSQALSDGLLTEPAEVVEAGQVINQESSRMARLVDDLLYLSKMESGQAPLELQTLQPGPLVAARIAAVARRAAEAGIELRWVPRPAPSVRLDPRRIERVVDNLLDNALRHTPPGGAITVRLWPAATPGEPAAAHGGPADQSGAAAPRHGPGVLLSFHNTGSSIPAEDLPRIFERFYQVDKARAAGSSGLGLAISREIVQAHGGRCWAESSPERGTAFFVLLPALAEGWDGAANPATPDPSAAPRTVIPVGSARGTSG